MKEFFKVGYPSLKQNESDTTKCVSCMLCQEYCPAACLEITKPNMVNFPPSIKSGEAPLHFYLDVSACVKCGNCVAVCPTQALEMDAKYSALKVDLVVENQGKKSDHAEK